MQGYDGDWTDGQRGVYDECYRAGTDWAGDPRTPRPRTSSR
ncbi:hypothetical protein [Micromonospora chersina]|uniref:Uncharacterized protein n=1 Tax=Micromonospora chersina TaxID=47854 RepID=A0A1C6UMG0_9ACTN|nr:hypothetical protein [Micromonospora chersina]SCL55158.1 hypothetical protein GA0070603_1951 [Micromonospora chersina]